MNIFRTLCLIISWLASTATAEAASQDALLHKVIEAYRITALESHLGSLGAKERLGQALFFDTFVSGPRQIACATCHVRSKGAGDALKMAVGLGADGMSTDRMKSTEAFVIPRNALPMFNRGSADFIAFFWDGRVQVGAKGRIESPLGDVLPLGFDNALAAASVFPLAEPDEMLGRSNSPNHDLFYHGGLLSADDDSNNFQERTTTVFTNLIQRLLAPENKSPALTVMRYRTLFADAYPGVPLNQIKITQVGNALSAYITLAFALQPAAWDRYVAGDNQALTNDQKKGAFVFFGKGRCAVCHSGQQFSDFGFHSLAIPQQRVGKHGKFIDYGRAGASSRAQDRFAFRTPPLRNVTQTGPWGHNGMFKSLDEIITHHFNPVPVLFKAQRESPDEAAQAGKLLGSRSALLAEMGNLSAEDTRLLISFLQSLDSVPVLPDAIAVPKDVPSGDLRFAQVE